MQSTNTESTSNQKQRTRSTGFGDTLENLFSAVGIDKAVKFIAGEDCGCSDRREVLNKLFPYQKPECLNEKEYNFLSKFFEVKRTQIKPNEQSALLDVYKKLERVYKEYDKQE